MRHESKKRLVGRGRQPIGGTGPGAGGAQNQEKQCMKIP